MDKKNLKQHLVVCAVILAASLISALTALPGRTQAIAENNTVLSVTKAPYSNTYDNTLSYSLTLNDPDGISFISLSTASGFPLWNFYTANTSQCSTTKAIGAIMLWPSNFPLSGYIVDCVNTNVPYNIRASMPSTPTTTVSGDTTPPSTPAGITVDEKYYPNVHVSWITSSDNVAVAGYKIYVNGSLKDSFPNNNPPGSILIYSDSNYNAGTTYSFTVAAYDAAGNVSPQGAPVYFTTHGSSGDTQPPSTPTSLSAYVNSSTQISLSWAASTDNMGVTGYKIYRNGVEIGWHSSATTPAYTSTGLSPGTSYSYTVAAQDAAGNLSLQSASVSATTLSSVILVTLPATPDHFVASASGSDVSLYWQENPDYWNSIHTSESKLYRRLQGSSSWTLISSKSVDTQYYWYDRYTDAGLASGAYEYRMNFCNSAGC